MLNGIELKRAHFFVNVPQPGVSEGWSSIQAATCYFLFNHSKVEAFPLSSLHKNTKGEANLLTNLRIIPYNAERQAGKL